jgi:hypothetical protein
VLFAATALQGAVTLRRAECDSFPYPGGWWELLVALGAIYVYRFALRNGVSGIRRSLITGCLVASLIGVFSLYGTLLAAAWLCASHTPLIPSGPTPAPNVMELVVPVACLLAFVPCFIMGMLSPPEDAARRPRWETIVWNTGLALTGLMALAFYVLWIVVIALLWK